MLVMSWEVAFGLITSCAGRALGRVCRGGGYIVTSIQPEPEIVIKEWQNSSAFVFIFHNCSCQLDEVPKVPVNML